MMIIDGGDIDYKSIYSESMVRNEPMMQRCRQNILLNERLANPEGYVH